MALSLKKWRNPTTFDVRIYVNGHDLRGKVWLEQDNAGTCRMATDDQARLERYRDLVTEALEELELSLTSKFSDVLKEATW